MARKIDKIGTTLGKLLKARGLEGRIQEYRIVDQWNRAVGPAIARHAQPQALRGAKLSLVVDSPAWMQQLSLLKPEIIEKINEALGREAVRDIILRLGEVHVSDELPSDEGPAETALGREERLKIERYVGNIRDPDTRDTVRRVIEKDLQSKKRGKH